MEPPPAPQQEPQPPQDQFVAALELLKAGKATEAAWAAESLINGYPELPIGHILRSMIHEQKRDLAAAKTEIQAALARAPEDPLCLTTLARLAFHSGDWDEARVTADRIPMDVGVWRDGQLWKARAINALGHPKDALAVVDALEPATVQQAIFAAAIEAHLGQDTSARSRLDQALGDGPIKNQVMRRAGFNLAAVCDRLGDYEAAFVAASKSNAATPRTFDPENWQSKTEGTMATYGQNAYLGMPSQQDPRAIFLVGLPLSGQLQLERMLGDHPRVGIHQMPRAILKILQHVHAQCLKDGLSACPELFTEAGNELRAAMSKADPDASRIVFRAPLLDRVAGVIPLCLPEAMLLCLRRNPLDTLLAIYFEHLKLSTNPYSTNLIDLLAAYKSHRQLMSHWERVLPAPMHTVHYESLVFNDLDARQELFRFLDLPFDPACVVEYSMPTAKNHQERASAPLSDAAWKVDHWKHYAAHLESLKHAINALESGEAPEVGP
ncbi:MAG: sulfotransferase [Phycisphaerales bacterium]|nr:sulfotransferase [Phycisphaerales bacterium]